MPFRLYLYKDNLVDVNTSVWLREGKRILFTEVGDDVYISVISPVFIKILDQIILTNSPAAAREILGTTDNRLKIDLSEFSQFRVTLNVVTPGVAGADVYFEGSLNETNWDFLDKDTGPEVAIDSTGIKASGWVDIGLMYKFSDVFIRMVEKDGDGATDPELSQIVLHLK